MLFALIHLRMVPLLAGPTVQFAEDIGLLVALCGSGFFQGIGVEGLYLTRCLDQSSGIGEWGQGYAGAWGQSGLVHAQAAGRTPRCRDSACGRCRSGRGLPAHRCGFVRRKFTEQRGQVVWTQPGKSAEVQGKRRGKGVGERTL